METKLCCLQAHGVTGSWFQTSSILVMELNTFFQPRTISLVVETAPAPAVTFCGNGACVCGLDRDSSHSQRPKTDLLVKRWLHRVLMHWSKVSCKLDSITVIDKGSWWTSQLGFLKTHTHTHKYNVIETTNSSTNASQHKNMKHNNCLCRDLQ